MKRFALKSLFHMRNSMIILVLVALAMLLAASRGGNRQVPPAQSRGNRTLGKDGASPMADTPPNHRAAWQIEGFDRTALYSKIHGFVRVYHVDQRFPEEPKHLQDKDLCVHYFAKKSLSWYAPNIRP